MGECSAQTKVSSPGTIATEQSDIIFHKVRRSRYTELPGKVRDNVRDGSELQRRAADSAC